MKTVVGKVTESSCSASGDHSFCGHFSYCLLALLMAAVDPFAVCGNEWKCVKLPSSRENELEGPAPKDWLKWSLGAVMIMTRYLSLRDVACSACTSGKACLSNPISQVSTLRQAKACSWESGRKRRRRAGRVPGTCSRKMYKPSLDPALRFTWLAEKNKSFPRTEA